MTLSRLPLSYCTNVHAAQTVTEVREGLREFTQPVRQNLARPIAAGLWLSASVIDELTAAPELQKQLGDDLAERGLGCYTLNAFPYGNFHSARVKEQVYLPDWTTEERLNYTRNCAAVLAKFLPAGEEGSISTVPLGFKGFSHPPDHQARCIARLLSLADDLYRLEEETGRRIRLAIEPEPFCLLETTAETLDFFAELLLAARETGKEERCRTYLGVCYDVCHQAVEFEEIGASVRKLHGAGIRINKFHLTCAIQLDDPANNAAGRSALAEYIEPRYLHQTMARTRTGNVLRHIDLDPVLVKQPPCEWLDVDSWRIHFHAPVFAESLGPLRTTRNELRDVIRAAAELPYAPHLEVETYTWGVLPGQKRATPAASLVDNLTHELSATLKLLDA